MTSDRAWHIAGLSLMVMGACAGLVLPAYFTLGETAVYVLLGVITLGLLVVLGLMPWWARP